MLEGITSRVTGLADLLIALGIIALSVVAGLLARHGLRRLERVADKTETVLDNYVIGALASPALAALVVAGCYIASVYLPLSSSVDGQIRTAMFMALIAVGVFAALKVIDALLRWYVKEVAPGTKTSLDNALVPVLRISVPIVGGLLGVFAELKVLGVDSQAVDAWLAGHGARVIAIVVLSLLAFFGLGRALPRLIRDYIRRGMAGSPEEEVEKRSGTLATVMVTTGQVVIIGAAVLMILNELIPSGIAPILAGVGVAGIAVGFGAQWLVRDILNGMFILLEGQYHVGDVVKIADISGLVEDINLRRTVLRDMDGIVHFVPNGEIRVASNFTKEYSKVNLNVSVSYETDLDRAISVVNRVGRELAEDPEWKAVILKAPEVLRVDNLGDSGIDLKIVADTKSMKQWDVMGQLRKRVKEAFDKEGIEIPYPHTKVYFGDSPLRISGQGKKEGENE